LQQWHLKHWKFKLREVSTEEYAQFILGSLLTCLEAEQPDGQSSGPELRQIG
jgi:hypothetical protein